MDKLRGNISRDIAGIEEIRGHAQRFYDSDQGEELVQYRWMLEEYRVSLFAQGVGTSIPVSAKRLDKAWLDSHSRISRK